MAFVEPAGNAMDRAEPLTMVDDQLKPVFLLHFEEDGTLSFEDLESDSWRISGKCEEAQIFRYMENHILVARPQNQENDKAIFQSITKSEMGAASGIRFTIHNYQDTVPRALPVAFSTEWRDKTYHMYVEKAGENMRVAFREGNVPRSIPGERSDVIFIKRHFSRGSNHHFTFESTLEENYFLAFEKDNTTPFSRLIVKRIDPNTDMVCESAKFSHSSK
ncbi:interleukin-18-like isoform X2 [Hemicordylus capensis]|uniref:interleukin-18-like isoform X2 n=1 Tax=Hemicordylus capensis TaxID=884348 RepID=UPI0023044556|nr:interleukin-18-like isoform X2 [Hemicordylus capensis]